MASFLSVFAAVLIALFVYMIVNRRTDIPRPMDVPMYPTQPNVNSTMYPGDSMVSTVNAYK